MKSLLQGLAMAGTVCCCLGLTVPSGGQTRMTLDEAIEVARSQSVAALEAKASFVSSYWAWRSYKASRLPSLNLYGNLASFDRSLRQLQNFETGELVYTSNYNMQNSIGLSIRQNLTFTGGTLSLYTDLSRIDQFGVDAGKTWYAQPVTFYYEQPLLAYNRFKWQKKISPKQYERAKRVYIESMEQVTINAVRYYFNLMLARRNFETARTNYSNTRQMYSIAAQRLKLGSVTRDEYLQLELRMVNDSISINENEIAVREAQMTLNSLLGFDEKFEIETVTDDMLPDIQMDYDMVIAKALENSSFRLDNEIDILTAESEIAQAKADRGASVSISAKFGLSNSDAAIRETYRNLVDQEVVGISFSIPIFDWGMGKGRVKEAEARAAVAVGIGQVKRLKERGCRIIATGEMGIGNTTTSSAPNLSFARAAMVRPRSKSPTNSRITATAPMNPSSSQTMEKMKSFCGSGTYMCFWRELPNPSPVAPPDPMA